MKTLPIDSSAEGSRRPFARQSLQTGVYHFIPLPFLDDWLIARQRKGMVRAVLTERGFTFDPGVPELLVDGSRSLTARLSSIARGLVVKPLRKMFRTVFFWITVREAARTVVETYFLGRFLYHPSLVAKQSGTHLTKSDGLKLATAFKEVSKNIDLKAARDVVAKVAKIITKQEPIEVTPGELRGVIEEEAPGFVAAFDQLVGEKLAQVSRVEDSRVEDSRAGHAGE